MMGCETLPCSLRNWSRRPGGGSASSVTVATFLSIPQGLPDLRIHHVMPSMPSAVTEGGPATQVGDTFLKRGRLSHDSFSPDESNQKSPSAVNLLTFESQKGRLHWTDSHLM